MSTGDAPTHDSLPDLDLEAIQRIRMMRLAGKLEDDRYVRLLGMEEAVALEKRYRKEQKLIVAAGQAAGLEVSKREVLRGDSDPRSEAWVHAIALVHPEGTPDNDRMRSFIGLSPLPQDVEDEGTNAEVLAPGGVGFQVTLTPPEERINAAVASLGDRKGAAIPDIVSDLTEALHARDLDLPAGDLNGIAAELARGEEVIVQVVADDGDDKAPDRRW